jgi:competence ComEA-like helix-hairpin-helix protein
MPSRRPSYNRPWEFTRGERNGLIALLVIILLVIIVPARLMKGKDKARFEAQRQRDEELLQKLESQLTDTIYRNGKPPAGDGLKRDHQKQQASAKVIQTIEINIASQSQLEQLPGIGPVFAGRIIKYRDRLGGFHNIEQLREVYGLPPETYEKIRPYIKCDSRKIKKLDVNTADIETLSTHPYISPTLAKQMAGYRQKIKAFQQPEDLLVLYNMSDSIYKKLSPYIYVSQNE